MKKKKKKKKKKTRLCPLRELVRDCSLFVEHWCTTAGLWFDLRQRLRASRDLETTK